MLPPRSDWRNHWPLNMTQVELFPELRDYCTSAAPRLASISIGDGRESFGGEFAGAGLAGENQFGPCDANFGEADGFASERFGAARIGVAEEDAIQRLSGGDARLGVKAGSGHEHRVAAAVDANFDGSDIEFGQQLLEVREDAGCESLAIGFVEKSGAQLFAERRIEGQNVVFLFVAGFITDGPIRDDDVGKGVAGAPGVVAAVVDRLIEDHVDDGIGRVADVAHGGALLGRKAEDDARRDLFWSAEEDGLGGDSNELVFVKIGDADRILRLHYSDDGSATDHAIFVVRLQDLDETMRDATEAAGQNGAFSVASGDEVLRCG